MAELRDNEQSTFVEIIADGDVILIVGPEKVKLRVHSLFLKTASTFFSAMLSPDWNEGHNPSGGDTPVERSLPEDNAAALKIICAIIHNRTNMVPQTLAASDVLGIAVTADKYDFVDVLSLVSGNWLQPRKHQVGDLMLLTAAAYLFRNAMAFREITRVMILNHGGPYLALSCKAVESAMEWRVLCLLEEQRSSARLRLAEILLAGIHDATGMCIHKCGWSSKYAYAYLKLLDEQGLWPTRLLCISEAIEKAEHMPDPIPEEDSGACSYGYKHAVPEYRGNRRQCLGDLNDSIGLCLHCVRSGSATSSFCRIKH